MQTNALIPITSNEVRTSLVDAFGSLATFSINAVWSPIDTCKATSSFGSSLVLQPLACDYTKRKNDSTIRDPMFEIDDPMQKTAVSPMAGVERRSINNVPGGRCPVSAEGSRSVGRGLENMCRLLYELETQN